MLVCKREHCNHGKNLQTLTEETFFTEDFIYVCLLIILGVLKLTGFPTGMEET